MSAMDSGFDVIAAVNDLLVCFPEPPTHKPLNPGLAALSRDWAKAQDVGGIRESNDEAPLTQHGESESPSLTNSSQSMESYGRASLPLNDPELQTRLYRPSDVGTKFDDKKFDLLLRAMKGTNLTASEQQHLYWMLQEFDRFEVQNAITRAEKAIFEPSNATTPKKSRLNKVVGVLKKDEEVPLVKLSKYQLDFGDGKLVPVNKEISMEVVLTNTGNEKAKFKIISGAPTKRYEFSFTPKDGTLKKKAIQSIKIGLTIRSTTKVNHVLVIEIEGGQRFFLIVRAESEKSVFGVDIAELPTSLDYGLRIPTVLFTMKNYLYEHNALTKEGIFRVPGDENESIVIKDQLNRGAFSGCKDLYCLANLIKVWLRELPQPILNVIPSPILLNECEEEAQCMSVYESKLPEPNKSLMRWIFELLADVASKESTNKMNPRNLAIIFAPNLYSNDDANPMESLMLSQKAVNFVYLMTVKRLKEKYRGSSKD